MELRLQKNVPHLAEIYSAGHLVGEGNLLFDGGEGFVFSQWKGHTPLPLDRPLRLVLDRKDEHEVIKAVVIAPYTYRVALESGASSQAG